MSSDEKITAQDIRLVEEMRAVGNELFALPIVRAVHNELGARRESLINRGFSEVEASAVVSGALRRALSQLDNPPVERRD